MSLKKIILKALATSVVLCLLAATGILFSLYLVNHNTQDKLYNSVQAIPANNVGLVLGASAKLGNGFKNLYFEYRMDAAAQLYHAGKVKHLIVSGDNSTPYYNEPADMRTALIKRGVPAQCITLDYAGLRTLDSVVRAKNVFGISKLTIVSQEFHNKRALYLAQSAGVDAIAYNAKAVTFNSRSNTLRETLARVNAVLDVEVLNTQPKFLGKAEVVSLACAGL